MIRRPAPGSMAAHEALVCAYIAWRGAEAAFDAAPSALLALDAEAAWEGLAAHAGNCGLAAEVSAIRRRVANWSRVTSSRSL